MQKVAAYVFERRDGLDDSSDRKKEVDLLKSEIRRWLTSKGAEEDGNAGKYAPEDGSSGSWQIESAVDGDRTWWLVTLHEDTDSGRRFTVSISITSSPGRVSVYVSIEAGWTTARVMPVSVDPRCPRIVRNLLHLRGKWYQNDFELRPITHINGFDKGVQLAEEITDKRRTIPILVISTNLQESALPGLDTKFGYDLIGVANVVVVDEDASWALTDRLGTKWCCYWGAVRLYWPSFSVEQDAYLHPLWKTELLQGDKHDLLATRDRFCQHVRQLIFRAAALSVVRPKEIDQIRDAAQARTFNELRSSAKSLEEFKAIAESYASDNDALRTERAQLISQVESLQAQIAKLDLDKQALQNHLQAKTSAVMELGEFAPSDEAVAADLPPESGEVRFYKKVYAHQTHDQLVRVADCGCNNWQGAHAADKAKKGIAKLEGHNNWKLVQHCASCKGGGMWKVKW